MIRIGLPKGRSMADTRRLCSVLGVEIRPGVLRYETQVDGAAVGVYLMKAPDIARLLAQDVLDLGLAGDDWLMENDVPRESWCFEVASYTATLCLLMKHRDLREPRAVVTPYPNVARRLLPDTRVIAVAGSSEGLVPDVGAACLDLVETGGTAAANGLVMRRSFGLVTCRVARSARCSVECVEPVVELLARKEVGASCR